MHRINCLEEETLRRCGKIYKLKGFALNPPTPLENYQGMCFKSYYVII